MLGDNYFGEDNCECLCKTCEDYCRNGWSAGQEGENKLVPKASIEEPSEGYSFRRRRRLGSSDSSRVQSMTPDVNIRPHVPKKTPRSFSRFKNPDSSIGTSPSVEPNPSPMKRKREPERLSPTPCSTPKRSKLNPTVKEEESTLSVAVTLAITIESPASSHESQPLSPASSVTGETSSTDATSVDEDTIIVEPRLPNSKISKLRKSRGGELAGPMEQAKSGDTILVGSSTRVQHPAVQDDCASILSDLQSDFELDDSTMTITAKKNGGKKRKRRMESPTTDLDHAPAVRVPGDYVLTGALLAEPESSWIVCKICEEAFVQKDAYFTRSSCPRCERHSKLYGYMWPKTDKEGRNDTEERVLDHRTVHRFIDPTEEKIIRKRDRGSTGSRAVTREVSELVTGDKDESRGRRQRAKR